MSHPEVPYDRIVEVRIERQEVLGGSVTAVANVGHYLPGFFPVLVTRESYEAPKILCHPCDAIQRILDEVHERSTFKKHIWASSGRNFPFVSFPEITHL